MPYADQTSTLVSAACACRSIHTDACWEPGAMAADAAKRHFCASSRRHPLQARHGHRSRTEVHIYNGFPSSARSPDIASWHKKNSGGTLDASATEAEDGGLHEDNTAMKNVVSEHNTNKLQATQARQRACETAHVPALCTPGRAKCRLTAAGVRGLRLAGRAQPCRTTPCPRQPGAWAHKQASKRINLHRKSHSRLP